MIASPPTIRLVAPRIVRSASNVPLRRQLHQRVLPPPPPPPTPFVPDVATFLTLIGRQLSQHASKIPSWSALFNLTSTQLKELGVEPPRSRRYLLRWREKFRRGDWGIGGDLKYVTDGVAKLRVCDIPSPSVNRQTPNTHATMTRMAGERRMVLNLPNDEESQTALDKTQLAKQVEEGVIQRAAGIYLQGTNQIYGRHVESVKGSGGKEAVLKVREGLWEHKRGHKVDGGERRKAEVRYKRRAAERKANRA